MVLPLDRLKPAHIEYLVPIDVTVTDDILLPPPPAVPTLPAVSTPLPTTRTTQDDMSSGLIDTFHERTHSGE